MTDEEAAIKVQAGLRAMWARKYVDVIRTYEKTMKIMEEEKEREQEEKQKQDRARMFNGLLTVDDTSNTSRGLNFSSSLASNGNYTEELGMFDV